VTKAGEPDPTNGMGERQRNAAAAPADVPTRVLVLGMAHEDGTIVGAEVAAAAEASGLTAEQVRSCLRRLVAEGLYDRHGTGREARYAPTTDGVAALGALVERTRLAYAQDAAGRGWDRRWRLVGFAVPEARRRDRDAFRRRLLTLGGAAVQPGLYVSPHPWHDDVAAAADRIGVADLVTLAVTDELAVGGERAPATLARRLWPVDSLAARYDTFVAAYADVPALLERMRRGGRRISDAEFVAGSLQMALAFNRCFDDDPLLPPELLPRPWPGRTARQLFIRCRRLGMSARQPGQHLPLFHLYDEALATIP
jgi:phenylacetic acid degradation operon negative regulatory protein